MELAIEVFEQGKHRTFVVRTSQPVVHIGRGWNNDVILRDPLIDAEHLEIFTDEAGFVRIRDMQSLNGTRIQGRTIVEDYELIFGEPIQLGHSQLVIHRGNEPVTPAEPTPQFEPVIERMQQPLVAVLSLVLVLLVAYMSGQFGPDLSVGNDDRIGRAMFFGLGLIIWSALWGVVARLLRHEMAFWGHLTLSSLVCMVILIADLCIDWFSFNLLSLPLNKYGYSVLFAASLLTWMFIGLDMSTRLKPLRRALISVGMTGVIVLVAFVFPVGGAVKPDPDAPPLVSLTQPPAHLWVADISVDEFLDRAAEIFVTLDKKVAEEREAAE